MADLLNRYELAYKKIVQAHLIEKGLLKTRSDREWNVWCTRRFLQDFARMTNEARKEEEEKMKASLGGSQGGKKRAPEQAPAPQPRRPAPHGARIVTPAPERANKRKGKGDRK